MNKLTVKLSNERSYPIEIKRGILGEIESCLAPEKRYFVITNTTIARLYGNFLKKFDNVIQIEDGEEFKNFKTFEFIITKLLEAKIERNDCIIAFGGGVVGDLAGFAAASVLRGIDYIQIPTTLLAQVDSSVGGKTGFNHPMGKNLIGAFKQPKMVLIDPDTLDTLNERQIKTGLGEVLKYSFFEKTVQKETGLKEREESFFDFLKKISKTPLGEHWEEIILRSVESKAAVVAKDETEKGLRAILNFGHTFGHAIEKITNYKKYTHGECVAGGMIMAFNAALGRKLVSNTYYDDAISLIRDYNLIPPDMKGFDKESAYNAMKSDKKVAHAKIKLVLPVNPLEVRLFDDTEMPLIKDSLL